MINWGILGTARIAKQQVIPAIGRSGSGRVLAVSSSSGRADGFADRLGIARRYDSPDALLQDPDIQAVYIPLPNSQHRQWAVAAARAGKHVLCEKPIALSVDEFTEIASAGSEAGVHIAEGFMYRHHPQIATVQELIQSGRIGRIVSVEARFHFGLDAAPGEDIRLSAELGGGALRDVGCYPIDLMMLLLDAEPDSVSAVALREDGIDVDTQVAASFGFGAVTANLSAGFRSESGDHCTILGATGSLVLRHPFRPDKNSGVGVIEVHTSDGVDVVQVPGDAYLAQVENFAEKVLSAGRDDHGMELSRRTNVTIDRVLRAQMVSRPHASTTAQPH